VQDFEVDAAFSLGLLRGAGLRRAVAGAERWLMRRFDVVNTISQRMRYERLVNPISIADGPVGELSGYLDHFPFSKGMGHWVDRHNSYTRFEAQ
jgi:hypothetical protein